MYQLNYFFTENVYPNIIASKKKIKHALEAVKDLNLNFDVTLVREEYSFASLFDLYAITEQVCTTRNKLCSQFKN